MDLSQINFARLGERIQKAREEYNLNCSSFEVLYEDSHMLALYLNEFLKVLQKEKQWLIEHPNMLFHHNRDDNKE